MADLGFSIANTDDLPDNNTPDFTPVPENNYTLIFVNSKMKPTNDTKKLMAAVGATDYDAYRKTNKEADGYLELEADIQDEGQYKGRKLFVRLNLINKSQVAAEIAAGQLKEILQALGIKSFSGKTEELHNKRLIGKVVVKPGKPYTNKEGQTVQGSPQNEVKKFMAVGAAVGGAATAAPAAAAGNKAPWAK